MDKFFRVTFKFHDWFLDPVKFGRLSRGNDLYNLSVTGNSHGFTCFKDAVKDLIDVAAKLGSCNDHKLSPVLSFGAKGPHTGHSQLLRESSTPSIYSKDNTQDVRCQIIYVRRHLSKIPSGVILEKFAISAHPCYYKVMSLEQYENFLCPYCGETNELSVDLSGEPHQEFVVDCEVCCSPVLVRLKLQGEDAVSLDVQKENE